MKHTSKTVQQWLKYLFPAEVSELKRLARSLPPSPVVVNIGAGGGTSGLTFMESRNDVVLHTIDITNHSSPFGCLHAEREVFKSAGYDHLLNTRWFQHCGRSQDIGKNAWSLECDLVFVDGDHSYKGACDDINNWIPHIKSGGILSVHDYDKKNVFSDKSRKYHNAPHPKDLPGVNNAVKDLLLDKYELISQVETLISFRV